MHDASAFGLAWRAPTTNSAGGKARARRGLSAPTYLSAFVFVVGALFIASAQTAQAAAAPGAVRNLAVSTNVVSCEQVTLELAGQGRADELENCIARRGGRLSYSNIALGGTDVVITWDAPLNSADFSGLTYEVRHTTDLTSASPAPASPSLGADARNLSATNYTHRERPVLSVATAQSPSRQTYDDTRIITVPRQARRYIVTAVAADGTRGASVTTGTVVTFGPPADDDNRPGISFTGTLISGERGGTLEVVLSPPALYAGGNLPITRLEVALPDPQRQRQAGRFSYAPVPAGTVTQPGTEIGTAQIINRPDDGGDPVVAENPAFPHRSYFWIQRINAGGNVRLSVLLRNAWGIWLPVLAVSSQPQARLIDVRPAGMVGTLASSLSVTASESSLSLTPGDEVTLTVSASPAPSDALSIPFAITGDGITSADYTLVDATGAAVTSPLTYPSGANFLALTLSANSDTDGEEILSFDIMETDPATYAVAPPGSAQVTIEPGAITMPAPPANLSTSAADDRAIQIIWDLPSSDGGSPITGYEVQFSTDDGATYSPVDPAHTGTLRSYTHSGLTAGDEYLYQVVARNQMGNSVASNPAARIATTTPRRLVGDGNICGSGWRHSGHHHLGQPEQRAARL